MAILIVRPGGVVDIRTATCGSGEGFEDLIGYLCRRISEHVRVTMGELDVLVGEGRLELVQHQPTSEVVFHIVGSVARPLRLNPVIVSHVSLAGNAATFSILATPFSIEFDEGEAREGT